MKSILDESDEFVSILLLANVRDSKIYSSTSFTYQNELDGVTEEMLEAKYDLDDKNPHSDEDYSLPNTDVDFREDDRFCCSPYQQQTDFHEDDEEDSDS